MKKIELTIRELEPFTKEELEEMEKRRNYNGNFDSTSFGYSDKLNHETRVLQVELTEEEWRAIKKGVISVF